MNCKPFKPKHPGCIYSEPNMITLIRLVGSLSFFILAILKGNETFNYIGLGIHWFGDVLDGFVARTFHQETIFGAEIDIIADRVEILFFFVNFLRFHPALYIAVALYVLDFAFFDFYLSYQFVKFGLISPNYFYKVDKTIFKMNYSPVGKFCNSTIVTLMLIFLPRLWPLAAVFALGLNGIKIYSIQRLHKRRPADTK